MTAPLVSAALLFSLAWSGSALVIIGARANTIQRSNFIWFAASVAGFAWSMGWLS